MLSSRAATCITIATIGFVASAVIIANAGPLDPPPGAPAPTYKTLDQVEPRIDVNALPGISIATHLIDQPGSYYLTGNITGEVGKVGIAIVCDDVSLDLNGFLMQGVPGSLAGLGTSPGFRVSIFNGSVVGWGANGITVQAENAIIRDLSVRDNVLGGIDAGVHSRFERCSVSGNGQVGIFATDDSKIIDCTSVNNGGYGFQIESRCTVVDSHASGNADDELICFGSGNRVIGGVFIQDPDPTGIAAINVWGEGNLFQDNRIIVNEAGSAGIEFTSGRANMYIGNSISTGPSANNSVAVRILSGAGGRGNCIVLDGPGSIGVLFDPGPMAPESCEEEEEQILPRAAGTIGVRALSGSGGIVRSHIVVSGDGAVGVDVAGSSHYLVADNRVSVIGANGIGVRLSSPASVLRNIFSTIAPNNLMITETTGTNSLISENIMSMRSTGGIAIGLAAFGNSMAIKNLSIGQASSYSFAEGVQYGNLLVDPGSGYVTDSAANLEIGP